MVSILIVAFFSFGHLFGWLRSIPEIGDSLGRFRYLVPFYLMILIIAIYLVNFKLIDTAKITSILNFVGIILIIFPTFQATIYLIRINHKYDIENTNLIGGLTLEKDGPLPDIYFIVLDAYLRQDRLLEDYGYDNSEFIQKLREMGFYVADCSRSNYQNTTFSISSTLNLDYVQRLNTSGLLTLTGIDNKLQYLLKNNKVMTQLKKIGYQTITFETGFQGTNLSDSDIFYGIAPDSLVEMRLNPFEALLLRNSAAIIPEGLGIKYLKTFNPLEKFIYSNDVEIIQNILDKLPGTASQENPKIVFAHIVKPHPPYVFSSDGSILTDSRYYRGHLGEGINEEFSRKGYVFQIEYLNSQILPILEQIIFNSENPPIIILEGDHGSGADEFSNLVAYYGPAKVRNKLYPSITPVNSFRLIFEEVFGMSYALLPDISYYAMCNDDCDYKVVEELSPECR